MAKTTSKFVCQSCGHEETKWFGKCPDCGQWNTAVESLVSAGPSAKSKAQRGITTGMAQPVSLSSIESKKTERVSTKISELDRVLGGGLVPGQVTLIAGEPGIGKSTLLLQVAQSLSAKIPAKPDKSTSQISSTVFYASGEESTSQIKVRAIRMGINEPNIQILETTDVDDLINTLYGFQAGALRAVIVDSIQTMATSELSGMAGSVGQVRECAYRLVRFAKETNTPVFIVGHVTKEGTVAGPSVLMHIVDTVLWFEGDKTLTLRLLRAVKNRFGPTDEVGVFTMEDKGLVSQNDPEKLFLENGKQNVPGSVISVVMQGTRPIFVEIQALVVPTRMAFPKRVVQGFDLKRAELLIAVLQRRCGIPLYEQDVFVNIAGGISIKGDPSADAAICMGLASAYFDKPLPISTIAFGEIGLLGEVRKVNFQEKRTKESKRLGYKNIISPDNCEYLQQAIKKYLK